MLTVTNSAATGGGGSGINITPLYVNGSTSNWVLWAATAQDLTDQGSAPGTISEAAQRTASTCYMRGLSEHVRLQTSSAMAWFWRRTVFTCKNTASFQTYISPPTGLTGPYWDGSSGIQRLAVNSANQQVSQTTQMSAQQALLFKGTKGIDWTDPLIVPLDTSRVTVLYDRTTTLKSGNQSGTVRESKMWHPFGKNLRYDDDESGSTEITSYWSTSSKVGMGDVFVLDQFVPGEGAGISDLMRVDYNSTLYWHEK